MYAAICLNDQGDCLNNLRVGWHYDPVQQYQHSEESQRVDIEKTEGFRRSCSVKASCIMNAQQERDSELFAHRTSICTRCGRQRQ